MKYLHLFNAKELDPIMASIINARFNGFFWVFVEKAGMDPNDAATLAADILRQAEIPQPGDELTAGPAPDLKPFDL